MNVIIGNNVKGYQVGGGVVVSLRGGEALLRQALSGLHPRTHTYTHASARKVAANIGLGWRDLCARPATGRLFPPPNKSRPSVVPIRFDGHGPAVWRADGPWPAHKAIIRWQLRFTGASGHQCLRSAGTSGLLSKTLTPALADSCKSRGYAASSSHPRPA